MKAKIEECVTKASREKKIIGVRSLILNIATAFAIKY
jgi:hypothetical protein